MRRAVAGLGTRGGSVSIVGNVNVVSVAEANAAIPRPALHARVFALDGDADILVLKIVDGKVTVSPEAFGLLSQGVLNVSKVKTGVITMCRLAVEDGKYVMHMVVGEGTTPQKWEEAGWTQPAPQLPGLEIELQDVRRFADNVMCQHYIISYGDNTEVIENLCDILGIEIIR